jgi:hypothetical protein
VHLPLPESSILVLYGGLHCGPCGAKLLTK